MSQAHAQEPSAGQIDGRLAFQEALRNAFEVLAQGESHEIWLCDRDFMDWPMGDLQTIEQLSRWALPHRRLVVLASDFAPLMRRHPRWVEWRRRFAHVVNCRTPDPADVDSIPCMLLAPPRLGLQLHDTARWRGVRASTLPDVVRMRLELDAYLQRSQESFPATTLGL